MVIPDPVCVVGAGPVGLTAALVLARRGVPVRVFERNSGLSTASRASTFHPSTLDLLAQLDITESLLRLGRTVPEIHWRSANGHLLAIMSYALLAGYTRHPYRLHAEQYYLTQLLLAQLRTLDNAVIEFETEVTCVRNLAQGVAMMVSRSGVRETVRAPYVLAADGARSLVRRSVGIAFPEEPYASYALRVITSSDLARLIPSTAALTYLRDVTGSASLLALPDHWRLIFRVENMVDPARVASPETVASLIDNACPFDAGDVQITDAHTYRLARGVAETYQRGRVVLIGDAAHITSTAGGLNMNCGVHDAADLASVIGSVLRGDCGPSAIGAAAIRRRSVVTDQVIPRSEARVAGVATRDTPSLRQAISEIEEIASCPDRSRAYLVGASMLDCTPTVTPIG